MANENSSFFMDKFKATEGLAQFEKRVLITSPYPAKPPTRLMPDLPTEDYEKLPRLLRQKRRPSKENPYRQMRIDPLKLIPFVFVTTADLCAHSPPEAGIHTHE